MSKTNKSPSEKMQLVAGNATGGVGALALFKEAGAGVSKGMKVRSRSPMLKPAQFPVGRMLSGFLKRMVTCVAHKGSGKKDDETKYGVLLEIVPDMQSIGIAIPATATLLSALEITEEKINGEPSVFTCPFIGHRVEIEKLADKIPSAKGQDAWNFLVAVSE